MTVEKIKSGHYLLILLLVAAMSGCIDKDIGNITDVSYLSPEYSLPLGNTDVIMDDLINDYQYWYELEEVSDTSRIDTINILKFDSTLYVNPGILIDTLYRDFDISTIVNRLDYVTSFMIRTNCVNYIPGKLTFQMYFLDSLDNIIGSLYKPDWFKVDAASLIDDKVVPSDNGWLQDSYLTEEEIQNLVNVWYIMIVTKLEIEDFKINNIIYYPDQYIWMQFGIRTKLELPVNEL